MKNSVVLKSLAVVCVAAAASTVSAQTTAIKLFSPVDIRRSTQGTGKGAEEDIFNSTILDLACTEPISAVISSSPDGKGNLLVDNYITFSTSSVGTPPIICPVIRGFQESCYNDSYEIEANKGELTGVDPDTLVTTGGVGPINVSNLLSAGSEQAHIGLVDTGGYLAGSTLYLVTNCTFLGLAGPGKVTGNPISQNNPTPAELAQNFTFNPTTNQQVQFTYDLTQAEKAGTLSIQDGTVPITLDNPLDPTTFSSQYLSGTSFATANCLVHTGERYNNAPACKLYTLACQVGTNPSQSGVLCPASQERNEVFAELFDGPSFTLPDIAGKDGLTFHQGVGLLEATDGWSGGSCIFDPASNIVDELCPQNLLTSFSGPGAYKSGGRGQSSNSLFITVAPVPEDLTRVNVTGQHPGYWINSHDARVNFVSTPPDLNSTNNFIAAPIQSLTYGISSSSNVPPAGQPVASDITIPNSVACPAPGTTNPPPATVFTPPAQGVTVPEDGEYLVHYFAQDCAGTQELHFTQNAATWATTFYTFPLNVDTVAPRVASGPSLSPPPSANGGTYLVGQKVTAAYRCTDDRSGIVKCGTWTYAPGTTLNTGTITSPVDTSKAGKQTFTVTAGDAAGNTASASVSYVVAAPTVNLNIFKGAPAWVNPGSLMTYKIAVLNLSYDKASAVTVTDPLPAGVKFVSATAGNASCSFASNTVRCTTPSLPSFALLDVNIAVRVNARAGTSITNTATVSSANPPASGTNQSSATTKVQ